MKQAGKVFLRIITCLNATLCFSQNIYKDVTEDSGINHIYNVYQGLFGGGVSVIDFNNDGLDDLYITGGESGDKLYKNIGDGRFKDISINAGIRKKNDVITTGVTSADINKDGFIDIFVTTFASDQLRGIIVIDDGKIRGVSSNILYINNGDETFTDRTLDYNLQKKNFSTSASFGDINADGYPDLFVANYFENFNGNLGNMNHFIINNDYRPELDELYLNVNGKYFENISELLVGCKRGYGFGAVFSDIDNDNDLDIYIVNDFGENNQPNQLLINQHPKLGFTNKSDKLKMSFGMKAMGIAVGDYNNDQLQDLHISNIFAGPFIVNRGKNNPFINLSSNIGTGFNALPDDTDSPTTVVGWGTIFIDYDNDADLDLFNSNGPINPPIEFIPNVLFENKGRVFEIKENSGVMDYGIGRGSVSFDYDNDGDLDLFVVNQRPVYDLSSRGGAVKSKLYKNISKNDNNWLKIKLNGISSTTRGLGARVKVVCGNLNLIREVDGGSSHASQNSSILHFGLAKNKIIDSLIITWPGGKMQYVLNQTPNCLLEMQEKTLKEKTFFQKIFDFF
mgnify:FL=1